MATNLSLIECPAPFLNALQFGDGGCKLHISYSVEHAPQACSLIILQTLKADYV